MEKGGSQVQQICQQGVRVKIEHKEKRACLRFKNLDVLRPYLDPNTCSFASAHLAR